MTRGFACSLLLGAFVTGCAAASAAPTRSIRNVLVYAKAGSTTSALSSEQIWRAHVNGRGPKLVGRGEDPSVSPDGRWIAFGDGSKILVVPTAGGKLRTVYTLHKGQPSIAGPPVWAPDSRAFGVLDSVGLVLVSHPRRPTTRVLPRADDFAVSPNSRRIAYEANGNLYVIPAGGGKPLRLTDDRKTFAPVWGKTGIAFVRFTHDARSDIWLSDGRPRHARQLTHTGADTWPAYFSANGAKLLAANPATNNGRLWAVDVATGKERPLTPWTGDLVPQGLSSDGRTVLAAAGCGGNVSAVGYVETIPFAGGDPHVIVRGPCRASWNAR
jgi:Tol biopolymer transport system component